MIRMRINLILREDRPEIDFQNIGLIHRIFCFSSDDIDFELDILDQTKIESLLMELDEKTKVYEIIETREF